MGSVVSKGDVFECTIALMTFVHELVLHASVASAAVPEVEILVLNHLM